MGVPIPARVDRAAPGCGRWKTRTGEEETVLDTQLKDYAVYRLDEREFHRELAGDSSLEGEAVRFAELLVEMEPEVLSEISCEVRITATGELIHKATQPRKAVC